MLCSPTSHVLYYRPAYNMRRLDAGIPDDLGDFGDFKCLVGVCPWKKTGVRLATPRMHLQRVHGLAMHVTREAQVRSRVHVKKASSIALDVAPENPVTRSFLSG